MKQEDLPQRMSAAAPPNSSTPMGRPRTTTKKPDRYGDNICERVYSLSISISQGSQVKEVGDTNAMEKPVTSIANKLYQSRETENNYYPQLEQSAPTTCQG